MSTDLSALAAASEPPCALPPSPVLPARQPHAGPPAARPTAAQTPEPLRAALLDLELDLPPFVLERLTPSVALPVEVGDLAALERQPPTVHAGWVETMARTVTAGRDLLSVVVPAILLALLVHLFLAQATVVFGQSMEPNLSPYQRLIVDKFSYRVRAPQRNEIVVVDLPHLDDMLVKRVVGLPGETIAVREGLVLVNGLPLVEPYPHDLGRSTMHAVTLGAGEYFVLGDNRDNSNDSRFFGPVVRERIVGRVWLRYWPLHRMMLF